MKFKSSYYICRMKCPIKVYVNYTSEFDHGHGPLNCCFNRLCDCVWYIARLVCCYCRHSCYWLCFCFYFSSKMGLDCTEMRVINVIEKQSC